MKTNEMFRNHPRRPIAEVRDVTACLTACVECADVCTTCADACIGEKEVQMLARCIRLDLDCADICQATARILARQTETSVQLLRVQLEAALTASRLCADECEKHASNHEHCGICAAVCRTCEQSCTQLISNLPRGEGSLH